jgi:thiol:disulfide interchange protein
MLNETIWNVRAYCAVTRSRKGMSMLRNLFGFAVLAVVAMFLLKMVFGLFGLVVGLLAAALWFAFLGFMIYLVLKLVAPETAARVREMIAGHC